MTVAPVRTLLMKLRAVAAFVVATPFTLGAAAALIIVKPAIPEPDARKTICSPINRELGKTGQRFRSAYARDTLKFLKAHRGFWKEQPPIAGRQMQLAIWQANPQNLTLNMRTAEQQGALVDKFIKDRKLVYSVISVNLPGMPGKYNIARVGLLIGSSTKRTMEYHYVVSARKPDATEMSPYFLSSTFESIIVRGFFYLINDDGNVVSPYFPLADGDMLEKPIRWNVLPGCQIAIKNL